MSFPVPENELQRLAELKSLNVLGAPPILELQALCELASEIAKTPIALVSLVAAEEQFFAANVGLDGVSGTSRDVSFCAHAIMQKLPFVVNAASSDARFKNNPLVTGAPNIQAYAGFPLETAKDCNVGALCVIDSKRRRFSTKQIRQLKKISAAVSSLLEKHRSNSELILALKERNEQAAELRHAGAEVKVANERFHSALSNMSSGLSMFDAEGKLLTWNDRYIKIYGIPAELAQPGISISELEERRKQTHNLELDVEAYVAELRQALIDYGRDSTCARLSDGRTISITNTATAEGGWVGIHEDITERTQREQEIFNQATELARTNMRFNAAVGNMTQGLSLFDADQKLVMSNDRFREIYELPEELLRPGTPLSDILQDNTARGAARELTLEKQLQSIASLPTQSIRSASGREILIKRSPTADGGWVATHEDVTEQRRAEAEISRLARHDVLTGLANRAEFNAKLEGASKRAKRYGGAITVMMLDLDKFKAVNDTLGHPAGDKLLVEVASRLKASLRETDVVARLGGDEFAIIQEGGTTQHEGAIALALRIIHSITQPFDLDGHQANIGTSVGIAMAPEHGIEPEDLLKSADLALYAVKSGGRNDYRIFQPAMLEAAHSQQTAESELRDAIEREEFELHYQPVMDAKTLRVSGAEGLIRWRHPTRGLIGPDQFIPLAESTGLIAPLGDWVLQRACADAASWPEHIKVAVNVSAVQFKKGNLFDVILCTLVETGLAPDRLELEITETVLLENQEAHLASIRQLKNLGISIALDDFGTGYSSMKYLTVFPFDKIKIDKSFTQDALNRRDCKAVIESTLALARGLGTVTTAEGVETQEQLEYMRDAGVNFVQGYLLGRPVPVSQLDIHSMSLAQEMVA